MQRNLLLIFTAFLLAACTQQSGPVPGRWYTAMQVNDGRQLFEKNCAACHGKNAEGTKEWKKRDAAGNLPPPPLNGSAHAWHHPMDVLIQTITEGGAQWQGTMPGFNDQLSDEEKKSLIAYFQSLWSKDIYDRWEEINKG